MWGGCSPTIYRPGKRELRHNPNCVSNIRRNAIIAILGKLFVESFEKGGVAEAWVREKRRADQDKD